MGHCGDLKCYACNLDATEAEAAQLAELRAQVVALEADVHQRDARIAELEVVLSKIDAIRNSIIGAQTVNWSEHVYPLVAALKEAGYEGESYEQARANIGTLLQRNAALEAQRDLLARSCEEFEVQLAEVRSERDRSVVERDDVVQKAYDSGQKSKVLVSEAYTKGGMTMARQIANRIREHAGYEEADVGWSKLHDLAATIEREFGK